MPPTPLAAVRFPRAADAAACASIAAAFAVAAVAVGLHPLSPMIDDWLYAAAVRDLVTTGRFRIGEISAVYPVLPILWGALAARVFGFSFGVLRLATLTMSAVGCMALYGTLREFRRGVGTSLLAALTVGASPTFFLLSSSFMTDAPLVALSSITLYWLVTGLERDEPRRWAIGAMCSVAAFLVRPLAVALPVAALIGAWHGGRRTPRWMLPPLVAGGAIVLLQMVMPQLFGALDMEQTRFVNLRYAFLIPLRDYANWNGHALVEAAFPMLPLVAGALVSRRAALRVAIVGAVLGIVLWMVTGELPFPLPDSQTWTLRDMAARALVPCSEVPRAAWTVTVAPILPIAGLLAAAGVCAGLFRRPAPDAAHSRGSGTIVLTFALLQIAIFNVLWLYNDRYYTALAPALAYLVTAIGPIRARVAVPMLLVWAAISVTGARDNLALNDTVTAITTRLESAGVPPTDIDAGWVSNGWRMYVRPERLPPGADRRYDVPYVTSTAALPYAVANCVLPGYEQIESVPLPEATWQGTNRLLVLRRSAP